MSFRDRAAEVKRAGEEARGDFTPTGAPLRLYKYWARHSKRARLIERENFCHFWRVVAIWAPLMGIKRGISRVMTHTYALTGLAVAGVVGIAALMVMAVSWWLLVAVVVLPAYLIGAVFSGLTLGVEESFRELHDYPQRTPLVYAVAVLTFPLSGLVGGVTYLATRWTPRMSKIAGWTGVAVVGGLVASLFGIWIYSEGIWHFAVQFVLMITGLAVTLAAVILAGEGISTLRVYRKNKRDARLAAEAAETRARIEAGDYDVFQAKPPREPGRVRRFFSGVGDFLVFTAQVVRVNKWKICPTVSIAQED